MKKERMIIAFLSLLFLLPGCKEEKTQSVFDADEFDCVGWPHIRKVTITNVNCEAEGIFLILEDSLVYCDDEIVIPYKITTENVQKQAFVLGIERDIHCVNRIPQ